MAQAECPEQAPTPAVFQQPETIFDMQRYDRNDPDPAVRLRRKVAAAPAWARRLIGRGVGAVLATLGPAGAVLVNAEGAWLAAPPPITPRSTVGAGDSSLAGYVRADVLGADAPGRLRMAVAYGSGAAALPGSALPSPDQINLDDVTVTSVPTPPPSTRVQPEGAL